MATGVDSLDWSKRIPPRGKREVYQYGEIIGPYFNIMDKPGGVEPGFVGAKLSDVCQYLREHYPDQYGKQTDEEIIGSIKNAPKFAALLAKELKSDRSVPRYMFKQDYLEPDFFGNVTIPFGRTIHSGEYKRSPKIFKTLVRWIYYLFRKRSTKTENRNAVLESLANNEAEIYADKAQEQALVFGEYANGRLKIITRSSWNFNLKSIGKIGGGDYAAGNYLLAVDKNGSEIHEGGVRLSDASVVDLPQQLALILRHGDYDALGINGDNKGRDGDAFYWLDCGHANRGKNKVVQALQDNFSFKQPRKTFNNANIFYDSLLSEKMKGVYLLQRMYRGTMPEQRVLDSYGPEFKARLESIKPYSGYHLYDDYIAKFKQLRKDELTVANSKTGQQRRAALRNAREYQGLIKAVKQAKQHTKQANGKLLTVFASRMNLTREELDFLNNVEKVTSKTALRSPDGSVMLNHLRVVKRVAWDIKKKGARYVLKARGASRRAIRQAEQELKTYLKQYQEQADVKVIRSGQKLSFYFAEQQLHEVMAVFQEDNIKQSKHPADFLLYQRLQAKLRKPQATVTRRSYSVVSEKAAKAKPLVSKTAAETVLASVKDVEPRRGLSADIDLVNVEASRKKLMQQLRAKHIAVNVVSQGGKDHRLLMTLQPDSASSSVQVEVGAQGVQFSRFNSAVVKQVVDVLLATHGEALKITPKNMTDRQEAFVKRYIEQRLHQMGASRRVASEPKPTDASSKQLR